MAEDVKCGGGTVSISKSLGRKYRETAGFSPYGSRFPAFEGIETGDGYPFGSTMEFPTNTLTYGTAFPRYPYAPYYPNNNMLSQSMESPLKVVEEVKEVKKEKESAPEVEVVPIVTPLSGGVRSCGHTIAPKANLAVVVMDSNIQRLFENLWNVE